MGHTPLPKNCEQSPGALQLRLQVIGGRGERTLAGAFRVVLESHKKKHSTELKSYALCANALQSCRRKSPRAMCGRGGFKRLKVGSPASTILRDGVAEWSKAVAQGAIP